MKIIFFKSFHIWIIATVIVTLMTTTSVQANSTTTDSIDESTSSHEYNLMNELETHFSILDWINYYQARYPLKDTQTKLINNKGDGFEPLYGVRNFRAVLNGVVYRGGANNAYNKYGKRNNQNPLPKMGLNNLCKEGFTNSFYLYSTNYNEKDKLTNCQSLKDQGQPNQLTYLSKSPFNATDAKIVLATIFEHLSKPENESNGPIYIHCWNGWHASGLMSALILRQYCGYSGEKAWNYWLANIDGHRVDAEPKIKKIITDFKPYTEFQIPSDIVTRICPQ